MKTLYQLTTADKLYFFGKFAKVDIFTDETSANKTYIQAAKAGKIGHLRKLHINPETDEEIFSELMAAL